MKACQARVNWVRLATDDRSACSMTRKTISEGKRARGSVVSAALPAGSAMFVRDFVMDKQTENNCLFKTSKVEQSSEQQ